jgi:uncharacterized 2Fe-2S/4Fe-4S cluster protein (DUF4445 family)
MSDQTTELVTLALMPSGRRGQVPRGTNLLEAARQLGVELESICASRQTCGKCQVIVESGHFPKHGLTSAADHLTPMDGREAKYTHEHALAPGRRLACACEVTGDLLLVVPEESQARKQIIAKAATDRAIDVQPAVRQVYVEVEPATLESHVGDWERLQRALAEQWQLTGLTIDPFALMALQPALAQGKHTVTVALWQDQEVLRLQPGYAEGAYGLAIDVGSTTIVVHLCDLRTGAVRATEASMNPQVRFGEDLMSRVSYVMMHPDGTEKMHRAVIAALNDLARKAAQTAGVKTDDVLDVVLVGNPVMHHLLLGLSPVELGGAPFALALNSALDLKARDLGLKLNPAARVHVLACIAGHVGADNVAVQLAEAPHQQDDLMLIVDVGTNAEIVLGNRHKVLCCSSPTGPAFEGAQIKHGQRAAPGAIERVRIDPLTWEPRFKLIGREAWVEPGQVVAELATGICGSGIIEAIAELYLAGIIDRDGRFSEAGPERSPRVRRSGRTGEYVLADGAQTSSGQPILVTQGDVRAIQLGKAALYAGVKLLMQARGVTAVDRIVLAGAFGSYIDPKHAMVLGLIPDCELEKVVAVGNAAGDGARLALLNREARREAARLAQQAVHVQTAVAANFQAEFVGAIAIPHAADAFPHLEGILPKPSDNADGVVRRSQRRRQALGQVTS